MGLREHGELLKVRVVPYDKLWHVTADAKALASIALYEMAKREGLLPQVNTSPDTSAQFDLSLVSKFLLLEFISNTCNTNTIIAMYQNKISNILFIRFALICFVTEGSLYSSTEQFCCNFGYAFVRFMSVVWLSSAYYHKIMLVLH